MDLFPYKELGNWKLYWLALSEIDLKYYDWWYGNVYKRNSGKGKLLITVTIKPTAPPYIHTSTLINNQLSQLSQNSFFYKSFSNGFE